MSEQKPIVNNSSPRVTSPRAYCLRWGSLVMAFHCLLGAHTHAADPAPTRSPLLTTVDLDVNESQTLTLTDGTRTTVKLLRLDESRDALRDAVREARVQVEFGGTSLILTSATYHLPVSIGGVQIDCPITQG